MPRIPLALTLALLAPWTGSAATGPGAGTPWGAAGLTDLQAATHLLDRFAFGARPGEIEAVARDGPLVWLENQLLGDLPGTRATVELARLPALALSQGELVERYSHRSQAQRAMAQGLIAADDFYGRNGEDRVRRAMATLERFVEEQGARPEAEYLTQLEAQKVLRAVYSESQLVEVLTEFWFNHFNVSTTKADCRVHALSYERDAIRPHVLGTFRELLGATARHPAMLLYLDNASSTAAPGTPSLLDLVLQDLNQLSPRVNPSERLALARELGWRDPRLPRPPATPNTGLNENYARELLELHTLGVDGGYRQVDIIEVARAFTGWTTFPTGGTRKAIREAIGGSDAATEMGFVVEGEFVFRPDFHDAETKRVLGVELAPGRGIEDGMEVLDLLAQHPATARHLAHKLAVRFVSEPPPPALVERLVDRWQLTRGDLRELVRALVESPEFWSEGARTTKVKTPLELAASTLRALDAHITDPADVARSIRRMGQPLYAFSAPTGYPDRGEAWTGVGAMLARFRFGQNVAHGRLPGVAVDLLQFVEQERLTSLDQAMLEFWPVLLPGRDPAPTLDLQAAEPAEPGAPSPVPLAADDPTRRLAAHAVGLLISGPEFQLH